MGIRERWEAGEVAEGTPQPPAPKLNSLQVALAEAEETFGFKLNKKQRDAMRMSVALDHSLRVAHWERDIVNSEAKLFDRNVLALDTALVLGAGKWEGVELSSLAKPDTEGVAHKVKVLGQASKMAFADLKEVIFGDSKFLEKLDEMWTSHVVEAEPNLDISVREAAIREAGTIEARQLVSHLSMAEAYWSGATSGLRSALQDELKNSREAFAPTAERIRVSKQSEGEREAEELAAFTLAKKKKTQREATLAARARAGTLHK